MTCLHRATNKILLSVPEPPTGIDEDLVLPEGPPLNPQLPVLSDSDIASTYARTSDFDEATLVRDRARAFQFFRWHEAIRKTASKVVAHSGDTIQGATHDISPLFFIPKLFFPLNPAEIPSDTQAHLDAIHRPSPMFGLQPSFDQSKKFGLRIDELIAEGTEWGMCTVYRCHITTLDGQPIESSPPLCLKLFDDRFASLRYPHQESEEFRALPLQILFSRVVQAELYALNEKLAYDKLQLAQGSTIPWFYGMHRVSPSSAFRRSGMAFLLMCCNVSSRSLTGCCCTGC